MAHSVRNLISQRSLRATFSLLICWSASNYFSNAFAEDWTRFRGPNGTGLSKSSSVPTSWSQDKNVRWKFDMPGLGSSSPIVIGDRVYVTCYTGYGVSVDNPGNASDLTRHLLCIDKKTGKQIWSAAIPSTVDEDAYTGFISEHGFASSTPVTDGKHIYVACGKTGLVAFDMLGHEIWRKPLGDKSDPAKWGDGASPILYRDLVIVNAGNTDNAFVALNKETGEQVWRAENAAWTNNWCTPIIVTLKDHDEMVIPAPGKILGFDPMTGRQMWSAESPIQQTVCASAVQNGDTIFMMGGRQGDAIAVRCGGSGDVTSTHVVWKASLRSGIGTPVVAEGRLYWSAQGQAMCADCATGKEIFKVRMDRPLAAGSSSGEGRRPTGDYASPVMAGDKVLVLMRSGEAQFWKVGTEYSPVGNGSIADDSGPFNGSPAIADDEIFIRSNKRLYCIAN